MQRYIGLMSGTSCDGVEAVLLEDDGLNLRLNGHSSLPYSESIRQAILDLCQEGGNEIDRMGQLDRELGEIFAQAAILLLDTSKLSATDIEAIGSHGQTIRHRPPGGELAPFTLQIADPNVIAARTEITTVADFRRRDMALGGEGAPLVPAFHNAVFRSPATPRAIVNIGGIANITDLSSENRAPGFDTGPGNVLMDAWIGKNKNLPYDHNGDWARSGSASPELLQQLKEHRYFSAPPPKSTGREMFNLEWLETILKDNGHLRAEDIQATLCEFTAITIAEAIAPHAPHCNEIYICGGGAENGFLMERLSKSCSAPVASTTQLGIHPQQVEAAAFAWLAKQTLEGLAGNEPSATGAVDYTVLGGIYPSNRKGRATATRG